MPENGREKTPHIPKMAWFWKGGKNGHFAKVTAKQMVTNGHKWSILELSLKIPKTNRNYPLKPLEFFYAENCTKTHLIIKKWLDVEKWQNCFARPIVRQSCQKGLFWVGTFKSQKYTKNDRSHYSYENGLKDTFNI